MHVKMAKLWSKTKDYREKVIRKNKIRLSTAPKWPTLNVLSNLAMKISIFKTTRMLFVHVKVR